MHVNETRINVKRKRYSPGISPSLELTLWIALAIPLLISFFDLYRIYRGIPGSIFLPQWVPMKAVTAYGFIITVAALISIHLHFKAIIRKSIGWILIITVLSLGLATLLSYVPHFFSGFAKIPLANDFLSPGNRMAFLTCTGFLLLGCSMGMLFFNKANAAHIIILSLALLTYFFILSFVLGVNASRNSGYPAASINTSIAFAAICTAMLAIRPDSIIVRAFSSSSSGGIIARQLLLPLVFLPVIIGWLRIRGEREGLFSSEEGVVIVAIAYTLCFGVLAWLTARSVNKIDYKRQLSEQSSIRYKERLQLLSDIAGKLLLNNNPHKVVEEICKQVCQFIDCQYFFNYLVTDSGRLHLNAWSGIDEPGAKRIEWLDANGSICGSVAHEGLKIIAEQVQQGDDPRAGLIKSFGVRAYACHPLLFHEEILGTLSFGTVNRDRFSEDDISLMRIVSDQVSIAISRIKNETALRESEDRFKTIAVSLPVAISITRTSDSTVQFTNEAFNHIFGYKARELVGKPASDLYMNPDDRNSIIRRLNTEGSVNHVEVEVKKSDGSPFWILTSIRKIFYNNNPAYLSAFIDVTENKKSREKLVQLNRTLNALGKSSQAMMHTHNEFDYLKKVCKIIIEDCDHLMVWVGYARNDNEKTVEPVAYYGFDKSYIDNMQITWEDSERGRGPTGTAIRTRKPVLCRNMQTDPDFGPWREEAVKRGYASSFVLPLVAEDKAFGAISIYSKHVDAFQPEEVELLSGLANDLAYGIYNIRLQEFETRAAETIRLSEEKYRQLFDGMVEGFALHEIILDNKGKPYDYRFVSANPAFEQQTGLRPDEIVGKTIRQIMPDIEDFWIETYGEVATTGKSIDFENYNASLDAHFRVSAFSPHKGFFAVICENISRRIKAEQELKSTKDYLEKLINYANAPIIVWDNTTRIQLFNHAFEHLTGYKAEEVEGKMLDLLFPKTSLKDSKEKIRNALTKNWETIEIPILTKNNEIRTVLWNSANIYDADNKTVLSTIAQGNDITERIMAEQEVRKAKEKLDIALENANIGIWAWNIQDDDFEWDDRVKAMLQITDKKAHNFEDFEKCVYEDDLPHLKRALHSVLEQDMPFDTIFRIKLPNGDFKSIDAKARLAKDESGKPVRMSGVFLDITEMKKSTDQTLFKLNEELLRSNKELEQFAYVASHDLQEPLRMVSSFTQLLAMRYKDKLNEEANEFISFAVDGAMRMQRLINDLLQYSRINTRGNVLSLVSAESILRQTMNNLAIKIRESNTRISHGKMPEIFADEGQMVQLFQNIIENAIKFSSGRPEIQIIAKEEKNRYVFAIKDNGIGIEPQYHERIFQIFQRLHPKDEYGGTGIGLAICKRIVERHGGKIWVESKNSHGTTFKFSIYKP